VNQFEIDAYCRAIYRETREHPEIAHARENHGMGFEILMGRPHKNAEIAFIGYQPGDWKMTPDQARAAGYENDWVHDVCHYASQQWRLARRMQSMFGANFLEKCVGLNAIFLRARSISLYEQHLDKQRRAVVLRYCLSAAEKVLAAVQPKRVVVIGFGTMALIGPSEPVRSSARAGKLLRRGDVFGRTALATIHLTSGRGLSRDDFDLIRDEILSN
jgi:hypothetical protein